MKRKTILRTALAVPMLAAAVIVPFSISGMAEEMLEVTPRPENIPESPIPTGAKRIISTPGFLYEDFESMQPQQLSDGWVTIGTPGLPDGKWDVGSLGNDGKAMAGTSGYSYAYILGNRDKESNIPHDAWLFSPGITMVADREYQIEFCTYMGGSPTTGELLGVTLLNAQSPEALIKEIDTIQDSSGVWTLNSYTFTPESSGTYYLGFHCMSPVLANATLIDDVKVSEGPTSGFFGLAGIDVGVTDMLKGTISGEYEVINRGEEPLALSFKSASPEISVSGLPLSVNAKKTGTFTVEFTPSSPGKYIGELVIATNDPAHPEVSLIVLANVIDVPVTRYSFEDFEAGGPKGWILTGGINTDYYYGHNDARCFYSRSVYTLSEEGPVGFTTHYVDLGAAPEFSFWYKLTDCDLMGVGSGPTDSTTPVMQALISLDNGATFVPVWEMGQDSALHHVPSAEFQQIRIPLGNYAGKRARMKLEIWGDVNPLEHDFIIQVDDVAIGTPNTVDLRVVDLTGTDRLHPGETGTAKVYVENLGTESAGSFTIAIVDELGNELGTKAAQSPAPGEKKPFEIQWSSDRQGRSLISAVVTATGDADNSNDRSAPMAIDLLSTASTSVTIGAGQEYISSSVPLNLGSRETVSQSIYYANEIGTDKGQISSMVLTGMLTTNHLTEPFQIWVKESDRNDFSDNGWEDINTFTKVYEGAVYIPSGRHEFVLPFETPYDYKGGNLVVMMLKLSDDFIVGKPLIVHKSDRLRTSICSSLQRGQMIPGGFEEREPVNVYAKATFNMVRSPYGSVSGTVSDANGPISGAKVSLDGTQIYSITDRQGHYSLPCVSEGNRTLTISAYGYYTSKANALAISNGDELTRNYILTPYPEVTLSGTVTNPEGEPIEQVRVYLEGYADYKGVTDSEGRYEISGIYGDTGTEYTLRTESSYFEPVRRKISINENSVMDITLGASYLRVHNLRMTREDNTLRLDWEAPIAEFKHDNGIPVDYMGWNHGHSECAIFSTYHKHILVKEIRWYTSNIYGPHANFNVFIFGIGPDGYPDPNNVLYMARNVNYTDESWNSHILPNPIEVEGCAVGISCDGLLGLGRTAVSEDHPFTPLMHFFSGDSYKYELGISDFTSYMEAHPMLRLGGDYLGDLDNSDRRAIVRPNCRYDVYRLTGNEWKDRKFIGSTSETGMEDMDFATLNAGKYRYAVIAVYPTGESEEVMTSTVTVDPNGIGVIEEDEFSMFFSISDSALHLKGVYDAVNLEVYSPEGVLIRSIDSPEDCVILDFLSDGLYIARAVLTDGRTTTIKFRK